MWHRYFRSRGELWRLRAILCVALSVAPRAAWAAEPVAQFTLRTEQFTPPEGTPVSRCVLTMEEGRITFLPPAGWRVRNYPRERRVVMSPIDGSVQISFRLLRETAPRASGLRREDVEPLARQRFPEARIRAVTPCHTADASGLTCELDLPTAPDVLKLDARVAFVPLRTGLAEIRFLGAPEQVAQARADYRRFLSSFSLANPGGGGYAVPQVPTNSAEIK